MSYHSAHPLDSLPADATGDLRGVQLRHGRVLHKVLSGFFLPGGVVHQCPCGRDFGKGLSELVLHSLELTDQLTKLLPVIPDIPESSSQTIFCR